MLKKISLTDAILSSYKLDRSYKLRAFKVIYKILLFLCAETPLHH